MTNFLASDNSLLQDFLAVSTWQSALAIIAFIAIQVGFWIFLKKIKIPFMFRIITGMVIGLLFGIIIQSTIGFPGKEEFNLGFIIDEDGNNTGVMVNEGYRWIYELNIWAQFFKNIFINGVMLLTVPIVFIAIFKITAKPGETGLGRLTGKGIALLLINVAVMFAITFFLGLLFKVGEGFTLNPDDAKGGYDSVPLPEIIWGYIPNNFIGALAKTVIIPVMVLGALVGFSVNILSRKKPDEMAKIRNAMNTGWDVTMSVLMTFMKIMPLAVMSMMTVAIVSRPIGELVVIGKVIGVGYLGVAISLIWLTLLLFLYGIKPGKWWKKGYKPLVQGFATQSSNATLPILMETLKDDMKIHDKASSTIPPISTTMGLIACAGVQAGLATSILWTATGGEAVLGMDLFTFFIMGLVVTVVASLGIAGVPGTATVVTVGVLGGMGFAGYTNSVLGVIAPLDGIFDMGRTGANVTGGAAVATLVAKSEGLIEEDSDILTPAQLVRQKQIRKVWEAKDKLNIVYQKLDREMSKKLHAPDLTKEEKAAITAENKAAKLVEKNNYKKLKAELKADKEARDNLIVALKQDRAAKKLAGPKEDKIKKDKKSIDFKAMFKKDETKSTVRKEKVQKVEPIKKAVVQEEVKPIVKHEEVKPVVEKVETPPVVKTEEVKPVEQPVIMQPIFIPEEGKTEAKHEEPKPVIKKVEPIKEVKPVAPKASAKPVTEVQKRSLTDGSADIKESRQELQKQATALRKDAKKNNIQIAESDLRDMTKKEVLVEINKLKNTK